MKLFLCSCSRTCNEAHLFRSLAEEYQFGQRRSFPGHRMDLRGLYFSMDRWTDLGASFCLKLDFWLASQFASVYQSLHSFHVQMKQTPNAPNRLIFVEFLEQDGKVRSLCCQVRQICMRVSDNHKSSSILSLALDSTLCKTRQKT